jgi:hypothetical protein
LQRTGIAKLPLHTGKAPRWLVARMTKLARQIVTIVIDEYGQEAFLQRIADPYWFQALGCVLGYDWHSSGVTTVLTGVLKNAVIPEEHGIAVCGGKGKASLKTPSEIELISEGFGFSTSKIEELRYASKMSAKVDNAAIQAGYQLYHHAFFLTEKSDWAVVQQGMCTLDRTARRYHWISSNLESFVVEPHNAIVGETVRAKALDMTAQQSENCRKACVDLIKENPKRLIRMLKATRPKYQHSLEEWIPKTTSNNKLRKYAIKFLSMPVTLNWKAIRKAYEFQPRNYEELLNIKGVGPATVRGLALIAELIYGEKPSWKDPIKYSFAYGGKDGVPYPVNRRAMDKSINILKQAIEQAKLGKKEKLQTLQRLRRFLPNHH